MSVLTREMVDQFEIQAEAALTSVYDTAIDKVRSDVLPDELKDIPVLEQGLNDLLNLIEKHRDTLIGTPRSAAFEMLRESLGMGEALYDRLEGDLSEIPYDEAIELARLVADESAAVRERVKQRRKAILDDLRSFGSKVVNAGFSAGLSFILTQMGGDAPQSQP